MTASCVAISVCEITGPKIVCLRLRKHCMKPTFTWVLMTHVHSSLTLALASEEFWAPYF